MYGDLLAFHAGSGGGGISVRFSGDTDAFSSDPSVEAAGSMPMVRSVLASLSSTSLSACDTMAGLGPAFFL
jgi:hypothetical protein